MKTTKDIALSCSVRLYPLVFLTLSLKAFVVRSLTCTEHIKLSIFCNSSPVRQARYTPVLLARLRLRSGYSKLANEDIENEQSLKEPKDFRLFN